MSGIIDFSELPPEVQARALEGLPADDQALAKKVRRSQGAKTRKDTGADFEGELDAFHAQLELRHWGKIRRNHIPTKMIGPQKRVAVGGADVDRSGWVSVYMNGQEPGIHLPCEWHGTPYTNAGRFFHRIAPVSFDAKVLPVGAATYQHDVKLQHQLHSLRDAANAGEYAFLLILARQVDLVFAIPIQLHIASLLSGAGCTLFDRRGEKELETFFPHVRRDPLLGWNWIPMLRHLGPV